MVLNRKGNAMFLVQNYGAAFDSYVQTLEYDPFSAETHLDLGLTYELQQQMDKAPLSYENAYKFAKNDDLRFMSLFNLAQLQGKAKKVDEAIDLYQKSLTIRPDSLEAKTNIELLIQSQQQQGKNGDKKDDQKKDDKENKDDKKDDKKDGKDPKDDKDKKDGKDGDKDPKDPKDDKKDPKDGKDKNEDKKYGGNPKPQPKKFDSKDLSEGDVKKILQELKQQEQKIRAEFNRKEVKEQPRDKDW
ncbi:MAG: tetratricopeptide repeat protein [Bdellovibrionaceae bacterium]|nr:tetratricopeptide repeat protein [Pseudobdellovibrionaceae bacterium]